MVETGVNMSVRNMPHVAVSWSPEQLPSAIVCVEHVHGSTLLFTLYWKGYKWMQEGAFAMLHKSQWQIGQREEKSFIVNLIKNPRNLNLLYLLSVCSHKFKWHRCDCECAWWFAVLEEKQPSQVISTACLCHHQSQCVPTNVLESRTVTGPTRLLALSVSVGLPGLKVRLIMDLM